MFGAAAAVVAAVAAIEAHKRQSKGEFAPRKESPPTITKCPSCGSRDFKVHAGERICSYCRSEA